MTATGSAQTLQGGIEKAQSAVQAGTFRLLRERFTAGETVTFRVATASMSPLLLPQEEVIAGGHGVRSLRLGDLLLYCREDSVVIHRLIAFDREGKRLRFRTKGDARLIADDWFGEEALLGRVVRFRTGEREVEYGGGVATYIDAIIAVLSRLLASLTSAPSSIPHWPRRILAIVFSRAMGLGLRCRRAILVQRGSRHEAYPHRNWRSTL